MYFAAYGAIEARLTDFAKEFNAKNTESQIQNSIVKQNSTFTIQILDFETSKPYFKKQDHCYSLLMPLSQKTLKITQNITQELGFLHKIAQAILLFDCALGLCFLVILMQFTKLIQQTTQNLSMQLLKIQPQDIRALDENAIPNLFKPLVSGFNHALKHMQDYFSQEKQLYAGIAHELKTPLAVIKTKCEVVLLKKREKDVYIKALEENIQSVNTMQGIIKTLLSLGRLESELLKGIETIDVNAYLKGIASDFTLISQKENKIFHHKIPDTPLMITINPALLAQIVRNFLQNAFKFTEKGKEIVLESVLENEILKICVIDTGCGISSIDDLCMPFKRVGHKGGAGLGLFLAKQAANALGGDIILENRKDTQGAIAIFSLRIKDLKKE